MPVLFPSTIIISDQTNADEKIIKFLKQLDHLQVTNNPDVFIIDQTVGHTIENVRLAQKFLSNRPYNHSSKVLIIKDAQLLLTEAQNALLKTLEQPPVNCYCLLTTTNSSGLLPTILSRCQLIQNNSDSQNNDQKFKLDISGQIAQDLNTSQSLVSDKTQTVLFLENQLQLLHQQLINNPDQNKLKLLNKTIHSIKLIKANVDPQSALDYIFLS